MHNEVQDRVSNRRKRAIETQNAATNIVIPKFFVGDLLLLCDGKLPAYKLFFSWYGPHRVVAVTSPPVCVVKDLITQKIENVHVARLKRYCGALDGAEVPAEVLDLADCTTARYQVVSKILDIQEIEGKFWLCLQ